MIPLVHLYFSNSVERLLDRMLEQAAPVGDDPWSEAFGAPQMLVPSRAVEQWLSVRMASARGCVIAPRIGQMEYYLWNALNPEPHQRLLSGELLQHWVAQGLDRALVEPNPDFEPLRNYLGRGGVSRRAALISRLSRLFLEYELNRPGVEGNPQKPGFEGSWGAPKEGKLYFSTAVRGEKGSVEQMERWQMALYRLIFGDHPGELRAKDRIEEWVTLPALARRRHKEGGLDRSVSGRKVLLFSPIGLSHFHRNLLISLPHELSVFQLNPCAEFWEDLQISRTMRSARRWNSSDSALPIPHFEKEGRTVEFERPALGADRQNAEKAYQIALFPQEVHEENRLLELWGEVSKESVTLWCQATDYDFEFESDALDESEEKRETLLGEIKRRLLERIPDSERSDLALSSVDRSIELIEAPTRLREVQALRDRILQLMEEHPDWMLSDLCVIVPDIEGYRSVIHRVFSSPKTQGLYGSDLVTYPFLVSVENDVVRQSLFISAVRSFFRLLRGPFGRVELFELLRNALVRNGIGVTAEELSIWEQWVGALHIYAGFDGLSQRNRSERSAASDLHTWWWGAQRLLLAEMSVLPLSEEDGSTLFPFRDLESGDEERLGKWISTIEQLYRELTQVVDQWDHPSEEGGGVVRQLELLELLLRRWIILPRDQEEELRIASAFFESLSGFRLQEEAGRQSLPLEELLEQLELQLQGDFGLSSAGSQLGALRFVSPRAGSLMPHRAIFWLGTGGDLFPGRDNDSYFDLLNARHIIGDQRSVAQKQFCFLESILAAQDYLGISWLGENIQKQTELYPSSMVLELEEYLRNAILKEGAEWRRLRISLFSSEMGGEREAPLLGRSWFEERFPFRNSAPSGGRPPVQERGDFLSFGEKGSFNAFVRWVRSPRRYQLERQFRLYDEKEEDLVAVEREPLQHDTLSQWNFNDRLIRRLENALLRPHLEEIEVMQLYRELLTECENAGEEVSSPVRSFRTLPAVVAEWEESFLTPLARIQEELSPYFNSLAWEKIGEKKVKCSLRGGEVVNAFLPLVVESESAILLIALGGSEVSFNRPEKLLRPLFEALLLRASGEERPLFFLSIHAKGIWGRQSKKGIRYARLGRGEGGEMSQENALGLLGEIASRIESHEAHHIPFIAGWKLLKESTGGLTRSALERWNLANEEQVELVEGRPDYRMSEAERIAAVELPSEEELLDYAEKLLWPLCQSAEMVLVSGEDSA